ncbi:ABC transporter ATP-binding protein [Brevibacterium sp. SMBL_HHYL_HB1]|jgi:ATP-binding cassette subfamily B protein|uniref:ABC transporter ATP-binding protein n=1 Tax=Brevibacterium sp. SMBL_HHYL_HB1 TaxID=2777556 RepID=UPI001BA7C847|nr:ABC transporter ATP-binding protein [Brevibacterium sp. SMBL_HHYL_HB1]QUL79973.1 ABC transporter ATP-binding protein [Brevibacterium sp. SMBL_HHYL_HB1]
MSSIRLDSDDEIEQLPPDIAAKARALLMSLVRPHLRMVVFLAVIVVLTSVLLVIGPVFIADALDQGIPAAIDGDLAPLIRAITLFVASAIGSAILAFTSTRLVGITSQKILYRLRERVFTHVQRLDLGYHEKSTSGRLVSRQTSDMESVQQFLSYSLFETALALLQMIFIAVTLIVLDVPLAIVVFAGFVPLFFITRAAHSTQRSAYRRTRTSIAKVIVHFVETMGGIRAVQAYRRQPERRGTLSHQDARYRDANTDALRGVAWFAGWTRLIGNITQTVIIVVGAWLVIEGWTQIGVLAAFILYLRRFYGPLDELVQAFNLYQSASAALEKIAAVLDTDPEVVEPERPRSLPARGKETAEAGSTGAGPQPGSGRTLDLDAVRFAYADGPDVLPRFDLHIPAGQIVALVGATGAGKSTLVKLVTRFYDPSAGRISLDEVDLRDLDDGQLRSSVVMVTQESFLFSGTIADNIRIGNPDAGDEDVLAAARAVGLDSYIRRLPDGYATDVKKRGGRLSSGQRQLVSFARVFLADPDVVVLDEATAHLDIPSERLVQNALATVLEGRTAIIIAHRLSTVEIADRVLVMEAGRIIEDGTPDELISGTGRFAQLHQAWRDSLV